MGVCVCVWFNDPSQLLLFVPERKLCRGYMPPAINWNIFDTYVLSLEGRWSRKHLCLNLPFVTNCKASQLYIWGILFAFFFCGSGVLVSPIFSYNSLLEKLRLKGCDLPIAAQKAMQLHRYLYWSLMLKLRALFPAPGIFVAVLAVWTLFVVIPCSSGSMWGYCAGGH